MNLTYKYIYVLNEICIMFDKINISYCTWIEKQSHNPRDLILYMALHKFQLSHLGWYWRKKSYIYICICVLKDIFK